MKKNMKKNVFFCIALAFVLMFASACGSTGSNEQPGGFDAPESAGADAPADTSAPARMARAARAAAAPRSPESVRGRVVIYTSMYEEIFPGIQEELRRTFPNLTVEFVYGGTGQIQTRIASEIAAGRLGCDIIMVAEPSYSLELKEKGILHPYISTEADSLAFEFDPEGYWYPVRISNVVLAFNPDRTARNNVPNSFYEFAYDTSMRGLVSMSNPLISGTTMVAITAIWDRFTNRYFEALGRQNVHIDTSAVAMSRLEAGQYRVIMVLEELILRRRHEQGSMLEIIYPADGTVVVPSTISIVNDQWSANRNTAAAEAILDWFLGPAGQNAIVDSWMHSVRSDFDRYPAGSIPTSEIMANTMPVVWENAFRERGEIHSRFEYHVVRRRH